MKSGPKQRRRARTKSVRVRLSDEELAALVSYCEQNHITTSEGLRRMARAAAGFGPTFDGDARNAILEYVKQLRAIGVNLNQIARILNSGFTPDFPTLKAGIGMLTEELVNQAEDYVSLCRRARLTISRRIDVQHG